MKYLQYFQKMKPASIDIPLDAQGYEIKSHNRAAALYKVHVADRISNYCLYILMFVLTAHAVVDKFKKTFWVTKEGLKILRVVFLAVRSTAPGQLQKIQSAIIGFGKRLCYGDLPEKLLTQLKTIALDLCTQFDTVRVDSDTVVSALWSSYIFSL